MITAQLPAAPFSSPVRGARALVLRGLSKIERIRDAWQLDADLDRLAETSPHLLTDIGLAETQNR